MTLTHQRPASAPEDLSRQVLRRVPRPAAGLDLVGCLEGSGYKDPPWLVHRADGQMLQLTPVLYAVLEAIDGERDATAISAAVRERRHLDIDPEDIEFLVDERLRPLGVLVAPDGTEPAVRRANPLLGIRGRARLIDPDRTDRIAARFEVLYRPAVVAVLLAAFVAASWFVFTSEGLGAALHDLFRQPGALLAVIALTLVSAAFHEVGHATACRYGGARPGVMGAGLYLVWPAFYTDVSDSYRLSRGGRLRVDLGGLYFNAVFGVGTFVVWAATRWQPLLVLFVLQLAQMARQLAPMLRFDGYHVLADLVGVPDLYARIKPVLLSLIPWRTHDGATALKPWARVVITLWVLLVVPILLFSLLVMVVGFPRLVATSAVTVRDQWGEVLDRWAGADPVGVLLGGLGILAIVLPVLGVAFLLATSGRRVGRRAWRATEDNPRQRASLVLALLGGAMLLLGLWWPQGQYRPIDRDERLTLPVFTRWVGDALTGDVSAIASAAVSEDRAGATAAASDRQSILRAQHQEADAPSAIDGPWGGHVFPMPPSPGPGDNQAVAIGYDEGETATDSATELTWASDGSVTDNRNEAYALASCRDCTTSAVAFQVVLVVGQHDTISPTNKAVALNERCVRCTTRSLAVQLVLPLDEQPDAATRAELEAIWARAAGLDRTLRTEGFDAARRLVAGIEHDLAVLLELDDDLAAATTTTTLARDGATVTAVETTTSTTVSATVTSDAPATTSTSAPTTTAAPSTTTTAPSSTTEPTTPP